MNWYKIAQLDYDIIQYALEFNDFNEFKNAILQKSPEEKQHILEQVEMLNKEFFDNFSDITLYHGSPDDIKEFKLTKGRRSGFMGSDIEVDNQAVFLSESPYIARAFGNNRSRYGQSELFKVRVKMSNTLDMLNIKDKELKKIVFDFMEHYDGKKRRYIPKSYYFDLIDYKPFVDKAKALGYDSASFPETMGTLKNLGVTRNDFQSKTISIFYPENILIENKKNNPIKTFEDIWERASLIRNKQNINSHQNIDDQEMYVSEQEDFDNELV